MIDPVITTVPALRSRIDGITDRSTFAEPETLVRTMRSNASGGISVTSPYPATPAEWTTRSKTPQSASTESMHVLTSGASPTSAASTRTSAAPRSRQRAATISSSARFRASKANRLPRSASFIATASPMPLEAPVIITLAAGRSVLCIDLPTPKIRRPAAAPELLVSSVAQRGQGAVPTSAQCDHPASPLEVVAARQYDRHLTPQQHRAVGVDGDLRCA